MQTGPIESHHASTACPRCNRAVGTTYRYCQHCGVDLALAAVLAEHELITSNLQTGQLVSPEVLVPRLGKYLISKGLVAADDLQLALDHQKDQSVNERHLLVGQALLELGLIDREKLDQAVTEQILELQAALRRANRRLEHRVRERTSELQHALDKLTELSKLKSNFISNISHELRTPLTHIKGYVELLAEDGLGPLNADQLHAVKVLLKSSERLENLINDLLRFSMAARGEFTLRITNLSLLPVINEVISQEQNKAHSRKVSLRTQVPAELPLVKADQEKITWVLLQLLDNAIKFTEPEGKVVLSAYTDDSGVTLCVSDTGIGIPTDDLETIFEPFYQLDGSPTRRHGGTGLGLALVRRITESHGSVMRVDSKVGEGSSFEFTLPLAGPEP